MAKISEFGEKLNTIRREWDKAELSIKLAEQVGKQVVFPAIKELRYAGRRLVDALAEIAAGGDDEKIGALIADALFDCYRARHDAVDAAISTIAVETDVTARKLGYRAVVDAFPDYHILVDKLGEAQSRIAASRGIRDDREKLYEELEAVHLNELIDLYRKFKSSQKVMRGLAKEERFWRVAAIAVTVVVGLLSLLPLLNWK